MRRIREIGVYNMVSLIASFGWLCVLLGTVAIFSGIGMLYGIRHLEDEPTQSGVDSYMHVMYGILLVVWTGIVIVSVGGVLVYIT